MTHKEYTENNGISQRTAAYRFAQCGVGGYSADKELTQSEVDALTARFGGSQKTARKVAQRSARVPVFNVKTAMVEWISEEAQMAPQKTAQNLPQIVGQKAQTQTQTEPAKTANKDGVIIFYASFANTLISIALTFCGMYMIAGLFGGGLGAMFGLFLLASVIAARNAETGDTSEAALRTVLYLELGACLLHPYTFFTAFGKMGVHGEWYVLAGAAVVCAAFVAVLSYNSVKLIRNYYAELKQAKLQQDEKPAR